jgi:hypothetical protein
MIDDVGIAPFAINGHSNGLATCRRIRFAVTVTIDIRGYAWPGNNSTICTVILSLKCHFDINNCHPIVPSSTDDKVAKIV